MAVHVDPQLGLINSFLIRIGLAGESQAWLAEPGTAMGAAIVAAIWKGFPFSTIVYLAALQNVDREQIEAATIDGAGAWRRLIHVVIPSMREVIVINLVLTTMLTFNYFDMIWVLTRGGPQNATHIFPTKIYELGFWPVPLRRSRHLWRVLDPGAGGPACAVLPRPERGRPQEHGTRMRGSSRLGRAGLALCQILLALIILVPFFWMVSVSLKPGTGTLRHPGETLAGESDA